MISSQDFTHKDHSPSTSTSLINGEIEPKSLLAEDPRVIIPAIPVQPVDFVHILLGKFPVEQVSVFFEPFKLGGFGDDGKFLLHSPFEDNLRGGAFVFLS